MPTEFALIHQYQDMLKNYWNGECGDVVAVAKEVDQPRSFLEEDDIKVDVKMEEPDEPPDFFTDMFTSDSNNYNTNCNTYRNIANTGSDTQRDSVDSNSCVLPFKGQGHFDRTATSTTSTSTTRPAESTAAQASFFATHLSAYTSLASTSSTLYSSTSSSSPSSSSSSLSSSLTMSYSSVGPSMKTSTYVKELAGSGCTLVSVSPPPAYEPSGFMDSVPENSPQGEVLEYTDLDKARMLPPCGEYDALAGEEPFSAQQGIPLEEALAAMKKGAQKDCDNLDLPYDPMQWTPHQVTRWVQWVCQREKHQDISAHFMSIDGSSLCTFSSEILSQYGSTGTCVSNELEFLKVASSISPDEGYGVGHDQIKQSSSVPYSSSQFNDHINNFITPCSSPDSSVSQDSNSSLGLFNAESIDEDDSFYSNYSSKQSQSVSPCPPHFNGSDHKMTAKLPGRGHKQTIHLWQFLRELLLSKESNTDCIRWIDRSAGIFKIEDSKKVAHMWGARKNRPLMNYDKLSRSVRQYYKKGIIKKTQQSKRLVYQFCPGYL